MDPRLCLRLYIHCFCCGRVTGGSFLRKQLISLSIPATAYSFHQLWFPSKFVETQTKPLNHELAATVSVRRGEEEFLLDGDTLVM